MNNNDMKTQVAASMKKMLFSAPVIERYIENATQRDLEKINNLLEDENEVRKISRRARYIKSANFSTMKSFADYEFDGVKFPNNFSKDEMLSLDFITKKHTIVFFGGCGSGKTHATIALGVNACNSDFKVKFFTLSSLVMYLKNAKNNGTLDRAYKILMNQNLICIDEWGYLPLDLESGQLLFSVISNAYERLSLIITTNLPFNEWGPLFTDEQLAAAMIDRIVHYGHLIKTGNKDCRLEHALMNDR